MAVCAILSHWLVFPQEGTTLLGMAGVAGLRHSCFLEHLGTG